MKRMLCSAVIAVALAAVGQAETIKLKLNGVKCDQCASDIITAIESVPGAKVKAEPSKVNPSATVDFDLKKADIGAVGKAVAEAQTPHKEVEAPAAFLVLDAPGLTAANAKEVGKALEKVKGVTAAQCEADAKSKHTTVALAGSGEAKMADIKSALATYLKK